jgi:hypothetical protein
VSSLLSYNVSAFLTFIAETKLLLNVHDSNGSSGGVP